MRKLVLATIATSTILTACGGGGSTSSPSASTPPPSQGSTNTNTNTTTPVTPELTVKVVNRNHCGLDTPNADAKLLIHNSDFSIKETITANSEGEISYASDNEFEDISIVAFSTTYHDTDDLKVETILQHPIVDMGELIIDSSTIKGCDCKTLEAEVITPAQEGPSLLGVNIMPAATYTVVETTAQGQLANFRVCKPSTSNTWPSVSLTEEYTTSDEAFGAFLTHSDIENFQDGTVIELTEAANKLNYVITNEGVYPSYNEQFIQFKDKENYFWNRGGFGFDSTKYGYHRALIDTAWEPLSIEGTDIFGVSRGQMQYIENVNDYFDITFPENTLESIKSSIDVTNKTYDYTNLGNVDYVHTYHQLQTEIGRRIDWSITSQATGKSLTLDDMDWSGILTDADLTTPIHKTWTFITIAQRPDVEGYQEVLEANLLTDSSTIPFSKSTNLYISSHWVFRP